MITAYSSCSCGAITLFHENGLSYSVARKNRKKFLPELDLRKIPKLPNSYMCDHCVNHYGMDLCACGSGEFFWECDNGFPECGKPMQIFGSYNFVAAEGSWLARDAG